MHVHRRYAGKTPQAVTCARQWVTSVTIGKTLVTHCTTIHRTVAFRSLMFRPDPWTFSIRSRAPGGEDAPGGDADARD